MMESKRAKMPYEDEEAGLTLFGLQATDVSGASA